jgi:hypothetical protein
MGLKQQMASDCGTVFLNAADFGVDATYTPAGGSALALVVLFRRGSTMADGQRLQIETEASCIVAKDDVAAPESGDLLTLSTGEVWLVDADTLRAADDHSWQLALRQAPRPTFRGF